MTNTRPARILLTGSAPFAGMATSASETVGHALRSFAPAGSRMSVEILPVDYEALPRRIDELIKALQPDVVLGLGVELGSPVIQLETTALNEADFSIADNAGRLLSGGPSFPGEPAAIHSPWPARELVAGLRRNGIPTILSHFAGTHLCNLTLYSALRALKRCGLPGICGFVHLPLLPKQVADMLAARDGVAEVAPVPATALPSMALEQQCEAIRWILDRLAKQAVQAIRGEASLETAR